MAIRIRPAVRGKLHRRLGVPEGQPIPQRKLRAALECDDPSLRHEANFARNAKRWNHPPRMRERHKPA